MMTRQRDWQKLKQAEGRCITCGKKRPKGLSQYCRKHQDLYNAAKAERLKAQKVLSPSERRELGLAAIKARRKAENKAS